MSFGIQIPYTHSGSAVAYIEVQYKKDTDSIYQTLRYEGTQNPLIVESLDNCSNYHIRVKAVCQNGQSTAWESITIQTTGC